MRNSLITLPNRSIRVLKSLNGKLRRHVLRRMPSSARSVKLQNRSVFKKSAKLPTKRRKPSVKPNKRKRRSNKRHIESKSDSNASRKIVRSMRLDRLHALPNKGLELIMPMRMKMMTKLWAKMAMIKISSKLMKTIRRMVSVMSKIRAPLVPTVMTRLMNLSLLMSQLHAWQKSRQRMQPTRLRALVKAQTLRTQTKIIKLKSLKSINLKRILEKILESRSARKKEDKKMVVEGTTIEIKEAIAEKKGVAKGAVVALDVATRTRTWSTDPRLRMSSL